MHPLLANCLDRLPVLPVHVQSLFALFHDPNADGRQVGELVCQDPALAAQTLRVCNSPFFALPTEVTSVHQAVVLLGMEMVQGLVLATYFQNTLKSNGVPGGWLDGGADHALATAHIARWLLQALGEPLQAGSAFTAGLIHDVGKLALVQLGPEVEQAVVERRLAGADWLTAERHVIGLTHAEAGGEVGELWGLPDPLIQCARFHHTPLEALNEPMACVVHVADCLAHVAVAGGGVAAVGCEPMEAGAWQALGIDDQEMAELAEELLDLYTTRTP
ncbi:MAG: hypothetical protein COW73_07280 [Nitrospirae bacterium CG18_big_fil_WC_8_21_14_2_50_70_55]|nr:HDOD domain-containing protein [Deltaproteobacteria bacterium]OIP65592.1 MAG: hypothetical protein AUK30_04430 [Nitrospirae bacterium CG2_30_70_394]PIQ04771.1 MAG: hypothetical protein COW73_07280 [Nitrospirae bacterium CG18_big_fil_WC_8_21_14_2_50_70_55]PIU78211.1 MAG: hypothetical protein COS73_07870 [Nitrospirae bacterium CG06_land_8_20_14_3_00_70_43]PIW82216.1 MAG: hypothetical protein COZ96_09820 [Nitrospirae bacterium CG_4_8_14_3_um_filter_70_85]PIX83246.1 MAG: hypothetical protein CO